MSSALFGLGAQKIGSGSIALLTDDIKISLLDFSDDGTAITDATNATPIVVTAASHGVSNGERVLITGVGGNTAANGVFLAANVTTDTMELTDLAGDNIAGSGAYTSGGVLVPLDGSGLEFIDDFTGVVASSGNLSSKTIALGIFDAADLTINSVSGDGVDGFVVWKDTGTPGTSPALALCTGGVTPDGNNVDVTFDANGVFALC